MVSKKVGKNTCIIGISYLIMLLAAFIMTVAFPFEIVQEVQIVDNRQNYDINELVTLIVGITSLFVFGYLGFIIGVVTTEESFKKV